MKSLGFVFVVFAASMTSCDNSELEVVNQVVSRSIAEDTDDKEAPEGDGSKSTKRKDDPKYPRRRGESDEAYWKRVFFEKLKEGR
jgi:hypothetical protein